MRAGGAIKQGTLVGWVAGTQTTGSVGVSEVFDPEEEAQETRVGEGEKQKGSSRKASQRVSGHSFRFKCDKCLRKGEPYVTDSKAEWSKHCKTDKHKRGGLSKKAFLEKPAGFQAAVVQGASFVVLGDVPNKAAFADARSAEAAASDAEEKQFQEAVALSLLPAFQPETHEMRMARLREEWKAERGTLQSAVQDEVLNLCSDDEL